MADTYANFCELARHERAGVDYRILARGASPSVMIVASHGGGIEPGTSEVADAAAAEEFAFYAFEGLKPAAPATAAYRWCPSRSCRSAPRG